MRILSLVVILSILGGCATARRCPPPVVRTESVCVGQQTVIRYRDFLDDVRDKQICPPIIVVTGQMCGR